MEQTSAELPERIRGAREGNAHDFDELLLQYMPLIEHQVAAAVSRSSSVLPEDEKDLRQEA